MKAEDTAKQNQTIGSVIWTAQGGEIKRAIGESWHLMSVWLSLQTSFSAGWSASASIHLPDLSALLNKRPTSLLDFSHIPFLMPYRLPFLVWLLHCGKLHLSKLCQCLKKPISPHPSHSLQLYLFPVLLLNCVISPLPIAHVCYFLLTTPSLSLFFFKMDPWKSRDSSFCLEQFSFVGTKTNFSNHQPFSVLLLSFPWGSPYLHPPKKHTISYRRM